MNPAEPQPGIGPSANEAEAIHTSPPHINDLLSQQPTPATFGEGIDLDMRRNAEMAEKAELDRRRAEIAAERTELPQEQPSMNEVAGEESSVPDQRPVVVEEHTPAGSLQERLEQIKLKKAQHPSFITSLFARVSSVFQGIKEGIKNVLSGPQKSAPPSAT